eukprot:366000-Chlamydomonas_euryale.AAC.22
MPLSGSGRTQQANLPLGRRLVHKSMCVESAVQQMTASSQALSTVAFHAGCGTPSARARGSPDGLHVRLYPTRCRHSQSIAPNPPMPHGAHPSPPEGLAPALQTQVYWLPKVPQGQGCETLPTLSLASCR